MQTTKASCSSIGFKGEKADLYLFWTNLFLFLVNSYILFSTCFKK